MKRFKDKYRIETTRLQGYGYAELGWYHAVVCTKDRRCVFGQVVRGVMGLSVVGVTACRFCAEIPDYFDGIVVDAFMAMPNHVHTIIGVTATPAPPERRDARSRVSTQKTTHR